MEQSQTGEDVDVLFFQELIQNTKTWEGAAFNKEINHLISHEWRKFKIAHYLSRLGMIEDIDMAN